MFSVKVDEVEKTKLFSVEELVEDVQGELIVFSREVFKDEKEEGFPEKPLIRVDGTIGKKIEKVKPFGKIEFINVSENITEDIILAYDEILKRTPFGSKNPDDSFRSVKYRDYNYVYLNRKIVARDRLELRRWLNLISKKGFKKGDEVQFVNVVPYARKLERFNVVKGKEGGSPTRKFRKGKDKTNDSQILLPNGVYFQSQRTIKRIMKGKAFVSPVKFEPLDVQIGGMRNTFTKARTTGGIGRFYLYPMIRIRPFVSEGEFIQ